MDTFTDNFSKQSDFYLKYRPAYPVELFHYLRKLTKDQQLAWDCGTGNGQAACQLANYYQSVYASDPSEQQIANAIRHERIDYTVESAERSKLENNTVDLITVAQAVHWFKFDEFYTEAKRVLKENGLIAVWAYGIPVVSVEIDAIVHHFHDNVVGDFWQEENRLIEKGYQTIPFPFKEIQAPQFKIQKELALIDLIGLARTWSATQKFIDRYKTNPIEELYNTLSGCWGDPATKKTVTWNLILRVGQHVTE